MIFVRIKPGMRHMGITIKEINDFISLLLELDVAPMTGLKVKLRTLGKNSYFEKFKDAL